MAMRSTKILEILYVAFFVVLTISCDKYLAKDTDKDVFKHLCFTQNEVVGDIITENQILLKDNKITTSVKGVTLVNIQGCKGEFSIVSSDENIVSFEIYHISEMPSISIRGHKTGNATITVKDATGQSAILDVMVKYMEISWEVLKHEVVVKGDQLTAAKVKEIEEMALSSIPAKVEGGYLFIYNDISDDYYNKGDIYLYPKMIGGQQYRKGTFEYKEGEDGAGNRLIITIDNEMREFKYSPYAGNNGTTWTMPSYLYQISEDLTDKYRSQYTNLEQVITYQVFRYIYE